MLRKMLVIATVSVCFWTTASSVAHAQRPNRSVSRPTLSPYLNLYRREIGYMDPHSRNEMSPYLRYFQSERPTRRDVTPSATTPAPSAEVARAIGRSQQQQMNTGIAPTGTGSTFMNLGHFYPMRTYRR